MAANEDWKALLSKIRSQGVNETGVKELSLLKDQLELLAPQQHGEFVEAFLPWAISRLNTEKIDCNTSSALHKWKFALLSVIRGLATMVEPLRPMIDPLMNLLLKLIREEAEDLAVESMQLFSDLHKSFRSQVEAFVPPFLDLIIEIAKDFGNIANARFKAAELEEEQYKKNGMVVGKVANTVVPPARQGFKMLLDSPVLIVLLFQLHRRFLNEYIPRFVPVVLQMLELDIALPSHIFIKLDSIKAINNELMPPKRIVYGEFIAAQVKMLSFFAYIARSFVGTVRDYRDQIPQIIIRLLHRCPPDAASSRKELLVAIRHILSTELRQAFLPHIETLIDEDLLLGDGYTAYYVFRPAAYSMLADLIHHVRAELSPPLMGRIIHIYCRALLDPTLPNGIQTMAMKLLMNLIDTISGEKFASPESSYAYTMSIFQAFKQKFAWVQRVVAELLMRRKNASSDEEPIATNVEGLVAFNEKLFDFYWEDPLNSRPIPTDLIVLDPNKDNLRDLKFQLKTLINGIKSVILALRSFHGPGIAKDDAVSSSQPASQSEKVNISFGEDFDRGMLEIFQSGLKCFDLFLLKPASSEDKLSPNPFASNPISPGSVPVDEKDLMDQFCYLYTMIDTATFMDIISAAMEYLIDCIRENFALLSIPQYFLAISGMSKGFATVLARSLMDRFDDIGSNDGLSSAIILRLFKLLFLAVSVYPEENEMVLQPHLAEIILGSFKQYQKAAAPINYFLLLRSLFRSIGGGRFDILYKEVLPLLQTILDELAHLSPNATDQNLRDLYVELCLTTPVRLSNLLPYLSYLMKPVLMALQSGTDLVNQGLRTFELCIDNLTPDFLEPILAPIFTDVMSCLWKMLKPPPANQLHSHSAVRLLGKLGGKARAYLMAPPSHLSKKGPGVALSIKLKFEFSSLKAVDVPLDPIVRVAMTALNSPARDLTTRKEALTFLRRSVALILSQNGITDCVELLKARISEISTGHGPSVGSILPFTVDEAKLMSDVGMATKGSRIGILKESHSFDRSTTASSVEAAKQLLPEIICCFFDAYRQLEFQEEVGNFLSSLYRLFMLLFVARFENHPILAPIDFDMLSDILMEYVTSQNEIQGAIGWNIVKDLYDQYCLLIPDRERQFEMKVFFFVADKAICTCFRANSFQRVAACRFISRICDLDLSIRYFWHHEIRMIRAILYVMKSLPTGSAGKYSEELTSVIFKILRLSSRADENVKKLEDFANQRKNYFDQIMLALVSELSNPNMAVRDAIKASFQLLSDIQGCEVTELLFPLKARVYGPIFSKPLRALPLHVQVGYIDAITYCLSLRPPLLEVNDELIRSINEAVAIIESEDGALVSRPNQLSTSANLLNLRVVCIKMLSTCLSSSEFLQPRLHPLRNQIVSVFFKTLYSRQTELVEVSRLALEQVMAQQHKLPTDLLQNGLRPVLQSLGEPRHLNLVAVEGLRRILQLFSHFFKAEIGKKLLDHLHSWADQQAMEVSNGRVPDLAEVKVVAAIMDLFCLLPSCGQMFIKDLFSVTLELEVALKKRVSSPFRTVLLRFVELYPQDAVNFFVPNIKSEAIVGMFAHLLQSAAPNSKVVMEMTKTCDLLYSSFLASETPVSAELRYGYAQVLKCIYQRSSGIPDNAVSKHLDSLVALWAFMGNNAPNPPSFLENSVASAILDVTMLFIERFPTLVPAIFLPIQAFKYNYAVDLSGIPGFCRKWLKSCSPQQLRQLMEIFTADFASYFKQHGSWCAVILRLLLIPCLAILEDMEPGEFSSFFNEDSCLLLVDPIWKRDCRQCKGGSCVVAIEELQLTLRMMRIFNKHLPANWPKYKLVVEEFLLNRLQSFDCSVKFSSLFVLAQLLITEGSSSDDVARILICLQKNPLTDVRAILRATFDEVLPFVSNHKSQLVAESLSILSRNLTKDGFLLTIVVSCWQSLNHCAAITAPLSEALTVPLAISFSRCAPLAFSAVENRTTVIGLANTLLLWHRKNVASHHPSPLSHPQVSSLIINMLIKLLCPLNEHSSFDSVVYEQGQKVLDDYLQEFQSQEVKLRLGPLEKLLSMDIQDENLSIIAWGISLLSTIMNRRRNSFLSLELPGFDKPIRSLIDRAHSKLQAPIRSCLETLFEIISVEESRSASVEELKEGLLLSLSDSLNAGRNVAIQYAILLADGNGVLPKETVFPLFVRSFQRSSRDYIIKQESTSSSNPNDASLLQSFISAVLIPGLEYGSKNIVHSDFPRGLFLSAFQSLWEHAAHTELLEVLLVCLQKWLVSENTFPTVREKVEILLVPCKVDLIGEPRLLATFLNIVYEVYDRPVYSKTELPARLEGAFLKGLCDDDVEIRRKFAALLDANIPKSIASRLRHIFETQRWKLLGSTYWMPIAIDIIMRCAYAAPGESPIVSPGSLDFLPSMNDEDNNILMKFTQNLFDSLKIDSACSYAEFISNISFIASLDDGLCHNFWIGLFGSIWKDLSPDARDFISMKIVLMLTDDSYRCQARLKPNSMESIIESVSLCQPVPKIPPFILSYACELYSSRYAGLYYLESMTEKSSPNSADLSASKSTYLEAVKSLGALYQEIGEQDYMFGAYRHGCLLNETNIAMSFEQMDLWAPAQKLYESAMAKCRSGSIPFVEGEFVMWEDRWISCSKKLQQWDLLSDISRSYADTDLGLECLWRLADWSVADTQVAASTLIRNSLETNSRSKLLEAFLSLNTSGSRENDRISTFQTLMEESIQLSLLEWQNLPTNPGPAHAHGLHLFQMMVELQESLVLYTSLNSGAGASAVSRPQFLADLKGLLGTWRERLPKDFEDLNFWSDILAWRQHVFAAINSAFQPLAGDATNATQGATSQGTSSTSASNNHPFAFRGYHEMAWLINRFAHVTRKNGLMDVCLSFLNRIYTLPNIEIQDAYLKLREQAKCYMDSPADLPTALEVVNATNLNYFSGMQKSGFFTLRSIILSRLGMVEEANRVFAQAVQIDLNMGHGWAAWGRFNDQRFTQNQDISLAINAINCYLQAATLFKVHKARKYLARIIWLLTFEDGAGTLSKSFEMYTNELPTWYWVTFIPQLLLSISRKEQRQTKFILIKIAKSYPQALYLPLRTYHEDCKIQTGSRSRNLSTSMNINNSQGIDASEQGKTPQDVHAFPNSPNLSAPGSNPDGTDLKKPPLEISEDIMSILKTAYPLLALTMENTMEHIVHRLRSSVDEDFYRVLNSLISEAYQQAMNKISGHSAVIHSTIDASLRRVYAMICNSSSLCPQYKSAFEEDFLKLETDLDSVIQKLLLWRARLDPVIKRQPRNLALDGLSRFLAEFEYHRYDDVDIPGQYLQMRDSNQEFIKIEKFEPTVTIVRRQGTSNRRLVIRGSDGNLYYFAVQNPAGRQTRREERMLQLFRFLDVSLKKSFDCRRRNLYLQVPPVVPISAHVRLVSDDPTYIPFQEIIDTFSDRNGVTSEEIFMYFREQVCAIVGNRQNDQTSKMHIDLLNIRTDIFSDICTSIVPSSILRKYMERLSVTSADRWIYRRDFIRQLGSVIFINYVFSIGHRFLHKIGFSRKTTAWIQSDVLPMVTASGQISLIEPVPFRLTPNIQSYVGSIGVEGLLTSSISSCARTFAKSDSDLSDYLSIFIRDELLLWYLNYISMQHTASESSNGEQSKSVSGILSGEFFENPFERLEAAGIDERAFFARVQQNSELIIKRAQALACRKEQEQSLDTPSSPLFQSILDLLSCATNPQKLAQMDGHWHPWF